SAERADLAENQLGKIRAKSRSSVSVSRTSEVHESSVAIRASSVRQR
ncbi:unnamed protein product, partial [Rotaria sp. Silwood1]